MIQLHHTVRKFSYNYSRELNFLHPHYLHSVIAYQHMLRFILLKFLTNGTSLEDLLWFCCLLDGILQRISLELLFCKESASKADIILFNSWLGLTKLVRCFGRHLQRNQLNSHYDSKLSIFKLAFRKVQIHPCFCPFQVFNNQLELLIEV